MRKTFKYRLFPTAKQRTAMRRSLDACRWVYNKALETRKEAWEQRQESVSRYDTVKMIPEWKDDHVFLNDAYSQCLQETCIRLDLAFRAFFRRVKTGKKPGYPRFKSRSRYDSFTYPQARFKLLDDGRLYLPKIGDVKIKLHRPIDGEIKTLTIRRDSVGNWYACFSCIVKSKPLPPSIEAVGVDLGLTVFAMLSNGEKIERQRWAERDKKDIARLQRKRERFPKGSPERHKVIRALRQAYRRQTNRRKNMAHQESRKLINRYGLIVFEDLNIKGMQTSNYKSINKGIADVAWGQFVNFTEAKAAEAGRAVIRINPKDTSQMCSRCGEITRKKLSVRTHDCAYCGLGLDRDLNAARNILALGLQSMGKIPKSSLLEQRE
jgi:putative transposase